MNQELLEAWVEPQQVQVSINWPAKSGCMAGVCAKVPQTTTQPLVCERGSVTDLCELNLQGPNNFQGICIMLCSARTCEVYEQKDSESTSYVSTVRGRPTAGAFQHTIILPTSKQVILRLLSLQQQGSISVHQVQLATSPDDTPHQSHSTAETSTSHQAKTITASSRSQQAEVKAMLQHLMSTG